MKTEYIILKEAPLTNNCPECYTTDGLNLSFKQQKIYTKLLIKTKGQILEQMYCKKCETDIFPGRYTDDIERVYNYHKKTITPHPASVQFRGIFYVLVGVLFLIAGIVIVYLFYPEFLESI